MTIFRKHYILNCRLYDIVIFRLHPFGVCWFWLWSDTEL